MQIESFCSSLCWILNLLCSVRSHTGTVLLTLYSIYMYSVPNKIHQVSAVSCNVWRLWKIRSTYVHIYVPPLQYSLYSTLESGNLFNKIVIQTTPYKQCTRKAIIGLMRYCSLVFFNTLSLLSVDNFFNSFMDP